MAKESKTRTCIANGADPKGREVFLYQYDKSKICFVEKPALGFRSAFTKSKEQAETIYQEQLEQS